MPAIEKPKVGSVYSYTWPRGTVSRVVTHVEDQTISMQVTSGDCAGRVVHLEWEEFLAYRSIATLIFE